MRGKVTNNAVCWQLFRITPAYAGKSGGNVMSQMAYTDHPRLCGEKLESDAILGENAGSPPPMRGKGLSAFENASVARITPAYAGKSLILLQNHTMYQDHPRLCGEKALPFLSVKRSAGSPPPMRGKAADDLSPAAGNRITPAYAGKRQQVSDDTGEDQDHPRLCGEKLLTNTASDPPVGSPPPMRGKEPFGMMALVARRITPAYAGKSN